MEIKTESQLEDEWGPANALSPLEIKKMLKWAKLKKTDTLYDLGSGHGMIVRYAVKFGKVKKAIGIEHEDERFCKARHISKITMSRSQLKKIDFKLGDMEDFDISDATVIYEGHEPFKEEERMYRKLLKKKTAIKIIKRHLPIVGYLPVSALRNKKGSWFFLMKAPLKKYRTYSKSEWISHVLDKENATLTEFLKNYDSRLKPFVQKDGRKESLRDLRKLIRKFLPNP